MSDSVCFHGVEKNDQQQERKNDNTADINGVKEGEGFAGGVGWDIIAMRF